MTHIPIEFSVAHPEFYAPLETARDGDGVLRPQRVPDGWGRIESGLWTVWQRPGTATVVDVDDGWKVHVSARPNRLQRVLDVAADICFAQAVPFKHLSTRLFYWWAHQKYAQRPQSGKFIAAYPEDVDAARRLMDALRDALADEDGPFVLTDRRYRDSRTVHYRYGAFTSRLEMQADGTRRSLVSDGNGRAVVDRRGVSFRLPDGVVDPFVDPAPHAPRPARRGGFGGFAVDSSVRFTNAGGTYRGHEVATGRRVFIKEARSWTGLSRAGATATEQLRAECRTLEALHALAPGLAPEPIAYFRAWEHEFLVTEEVPGVPLTHWLATTFPLITVGPTAADIAAYYDRCEKIISGVEQALARLRAVGYLFVDVSPGNVLIAQDDTVRLVDFGGAHRLGDTFTLVGTEGYSPPQHLVGDDLTVYDDYGIASLAQLLLGPLNHTAQRDPGVLAHMHCDLNELAPVPPALWRRVTRFHQPGTSSLPRPEQVAADPIRYLTELRDGVADALVAMADVDNPERVFPTIAEGYAANTVCVAYGTAGVVHALRRAGRPLPDGLLDRLRRDALDKAADLAPGLYVGTAGIAWVLADCGLLEEAAHLLAMAEQHPVTGDCATMFGGSAGVALAHLAFYGHTGDQRYVDRALALAAALPPDDQLTPYVGPNNATGLMHGRCGVALMLQQLAGVTGDDRHLARAVGLLHAELDRAIDPDAPGLVFPPAAADNRACPYLFTGSAGVAYTATRCLRDGPDERLAEALPRLLAPLRLSYTIMPGLFQGLAGFAFTLADHAALAHDEADRQSAIRSARRLFKFAVPHPTGVRFLGDHLLRFSAELWSGSAGIMLALSQVLAPRPDALFTVDTLIDDSRSARWLAGERRTSTVHELAG
ncbi:class III lanthionine synthetase LanKC [Dactylosporangium sp. CA-092794]|uniref:class III lanthionine synthetase LanKC n=1 Tax=Dactylosporangium sp. CA-092794 TaxID=3239929 RepID=UPI003D8E7032